jgi:hypothetical protein
MLIYFNYHNMYIGKRIRYNFKPIGKTWRDFARMSAEAYGLDPQRRIGKAIYIPHLSTDERKVYKDSRSKDYTVAIRGTENLNDVGTDIALALGRLKATKRFKREESAVKGLLDRGLKVNLTGHSLGSTVADELSRKYGLRGTLFNQGAGLDSLVRNDNPLTEKYRTKYDPVSVLGVVRGKFNTIQAKGLAQHGIKNFLE